MSFCFCQYPQRHAEQECKKHDQANLERRLARDFEQDCRGYNE